MLDFNKRMIEIQAITVELEALTEVVVSGMDVRSYLIGRTEHLKRELIQLRENEMNVNKVMDSLDEKAN